MSGPSTFPASAPHSVGGHTFNPGEVSVAAGRKEVLRDRLREPHSLLPSFPPRRPWATRSTGWPSQ